MTTPQLPDVDRAVDGLAAAIKKRDLPNAVWQVAGPATAGKSVLIWKLAQKLEQDNFWPIVVAPPPRSLDTGPTALVQIGAALKTRGALNGQFDELLLNGQRLWTDKINSVRSWLEKDKDKIVLLCDEPFDWPVSSKDDFHFGERTRDVIEMLLGPLSCNRVVTGSIRAGIIPTAVFRLVKGTNAKEWLQNGQWGSLEAAALALQQRFGERLNTFSPLELRLLIAHVALTSIDKVEAWLAEDTSRRDISRRLIELLAKSKAGSPLTAIWAHLALVRRPFGSDLLEYLGGQKLGTQESDILQHSLLYSYGGKHIIHDTLRADMREKCLAGKDLGHAHGTLAEYYAGILLAAGADVAKIGEIRLSEMEAFHHAASSGDAKTVERFRPFFVEQLDSFGRVLSRDARKFKAAAAIFERAISWDAADDYAHHYRAYNLDIQGEEPELVRRHYEKAIELNPRHEWWHARYVNFLITLGLTADARTAWDNALDSLGLPDPEASPQVYEGLHLWVAPLLLHRGQLEFADYVLGGIPAVIRSQNPSVRAAVRRLEVLRNARAVGSVFPGNVVLEDWWNGPHLNSQVYKNKELVQWLPGRIDSIDKRRIVAFVAIPPKAKGGPEFSHMEIEIDKFTKWTLDPQEKPAAGRFIELAYYGDLKNPAVVARVHKQTAWNDPDLPSIHFNPLRYLKGLKKT